MEWAEAERPDSPEPPGTPRQSMQVRVVPRLSSKRPGKVRIPLGSLEQARALADLSSAQTPQRVSRRRFLVHACRRARNVKMWFTQRRHRMRASRALLLAIFACAVVLAGAC